MNNRKYKFILGSLILMFLTTFISCDEVEDANIGGTSFENMSGDWWVVALEPDGVTPAFGGDYVQFTTYNSAANDSLWVDDHHNWFEIKTKVGANTNDLTFVGPAEADNLADTDGYITLTNGKITSKSFTAASKTKVDEISFDVEMYWAPGVIYKFKGHKRTGFPEDENPHYSN